MAGYRLSHLSDGELLQGLSTLAARDRTTTAEILAHIAEVDERKLYAPEGYLSMFAYCVGVLGLRRGPSWNSCWRSDSRSRISPPGFGASLSLRRWPPRPGNSPRGELRHPCRWPRGQLTHPRLSL